MTFADFCARLSLCMSLLILSTALGVGFNTPILQRKSCGPERESDFPKVTQIVQGKVKAKPGSLHHTLCPLPTLPLEGPPYVHENIKLCLTQLPGPLWSIKRFSMRQVAQPQLLFPLFLSLNPMALPLLAE